MRKMLFVFLLAAIFYSAPSIINISSPKPVVVFVSSGKRNLLKRRRGVKYRGIKIFYTTELVYYS